MAAKQSPGLAAQKARLIARAAKSGALATVRRGTGTKAGQPYVSKVGVALDIDGSPVFLFSTLAAHTQDLLADPKASLLLEAVCDTTNPLETARTTLVGRIERLSPDQDEYERARYLAHHSGAAMYANFGDFSLWRMTVEKVHYVGGFGLSKWAKASDYRTPLLDLKDHQANIVDGLNEQKKQQLGPAIAKETGCSAKGWSVSSIDPDGLNLLHLKGNTARLNFKSPATNLRGWQDRLKRLF